MDDFLNNARKQLDDLDVQRQLKDIDLGKLRDMDLSKLKDIDLSKRGGDLKKHLRQLDMQKREEEAANEGFVGGLLLGVVVGAILALIFAPKSGGETRAMVAGTATDLKHKAEDLVGQVKDDASDAPIASSLDDEPAIERNFGDTTSRPTPGVI